MLEAEVKVGEVGEVLWVKELDSMWLETPMECWLALLWVKQ
jgi:hypothetical protein